MPETKPRLRILVSKDDGVFIVLNEKRKPIVEPVFGLHKKIIFFENFMVEVEISTEFVKLGISKISYDETSIGYLGERLVSFLDEEGVYEFSVESKRFIRIPE